MFKSVLASAALAIALATAAFAQAPDHRAITERSLQVLEHQFNAWRDASNSLSKAAVTYCASPDPNRAAFEAALSDAWRAWAPLDSYQFGPIERTSAVLTVNFWPDKKNFVGKALRDLAQKPAEFQQDPNQIDTLSAAAQGYPAMEMLLFTDAPDCPALIGISGHIERVAEDVYSLWFGAEGWADLARTAGPANPVYLTPAEFTKTLYTAVDFGLFRVAEARLARPLGTPNLPFPKRAEAWRLGLTNDLITAQLNGVATLINDGLTVSEHADIQLAFADLQARLDQIEQPIGQAVTDPISRFRVEALQTQVRALQALIARDLGPSLGVDAGFSAADGD